MNKLSEKDKSE